MSVRVDRARIQKTREREWTRLVILTCFFLSGAAGLIYQVVWARRLTLIFGATVLGVSTVLTVFMAGLALGSYLLGRWGDKWWASRLKPNSQTSRLTPLQAYALLEVGIGLYGALTPLLFWVVERLYVGFYHAVEPNFVALTLFRFLLCFAGLLLPTTLMGGTLPILSKLFVSSMARLGEGVGSLYAFNTFGAVVGSFAAGFLLIPSIGVSATIWTAAAINLAVGLIAWLVWMQLPVALTPYLSPKVRQRADPSPLHPSTSSPPHPFTPSPFLPTLIIFGFALSGMAMLMYEVVWTRALAQVFGTSTYAFSMMLTAFLCGLALGSAVFARLVDKWQNLPFVFASLQVGIGISVIVITPIFGVLPFAFLRLFEKFGGHFWWLQAAQFFVCFLVMLPPTILSGGTFPVVAKLYTKSLNVLGRSVGTAYAANTLGTIFGSFMAGFVFMLLLGAEGTLRLGSIINVLVGASVLIVSRQYFLRPAISWALIAALAVGWFFFPRWDKYMMSGGVYLYAGYLLNLKQQGGDPVKFLHDKRILYYKDGLTGTVSVVETKRNGTPLLSLQVNGKTDASTHDLSTQRLVAHLPMLLHPRPQKVLVIGLASGCTVGSVERHPTVERVDCVEIEPLMREAARFFNKYNYDCLADRRTMLIVGDGRNHVMLTRQKYDVITSEPSNPWISGVANLFTREYYAYCRQRLNPDGVFCHWIPAYNMSCEDFRIAVRTFQSVFPHTTLWCFPPLITDTLVIGTLRPQKFSFELIACKFNDPQVAADLKEIGYLSPWNFWEGFLLGEEDLRRYAAADAVLHTDNYPIIEFSTPKTLYSPPSYAILKELFQLSHEVTLPGRLDGQVQNDWILYPQIGLKVNRFGVERLRGKLHVGHNWLEPPVSPSVEVRSKAWAEFLGQAPGARLRIRVQPSDGFSVPKKKVSETMTVPISINGHVAEWGWEAQRRTLHISWFCKEVSCHFDVDVRFLAPPQQTLSQLLQTWARLCSCVH